MTNKFLGDGSIESTSPYELARERFNRAIADRAVIKAMANIMARDADEEWHAACTNLRQYESAPGVPKPEYQPKGK